MNKILKRGLIVLLILILILLFVRIITPTQIDDIHPDIPCSEMNKYDPDVLWVIPLYEGNNISDPENVEWCEYIRNLNKTLGMHGVYHSYREFKQERSSEYLKQGIKAFEGCVNETPNMFKPPQLKFDFENKKVLDENNLKLKRIFNQITHKVYHCNNMDRVPNWVIYAV